jgi:single-stranded-DNA-specific exonuclease
MAATAVNIIERDIPPRATWALEQAGIHPLLARLYAARGVRTADELDADMARLLPPASLRGASAAAQLLADAIAQQLRITVVADYDCDGATACAVALRGLRMLGAQQVRYVVPDRVTDGYGLTPPIAERVHALGTDVLLTVDNGIASLDGVARAQQLGMKVLLTDHHLPARHDAQVLLPAAEVLVNPNQPACEFASKHIAGVGVIFYVLLALRAELRARGAYANSPQPRLDSLLPLVALGTVADVVKLDANNRRLVAQGLKRIRAGALPPGLQQLFQVAGRNSAQATTMDFGFALGPRINAAGRLADMTVGIECLLSDDVNRAEQLARQLDSINRERRDIEGGMREQALQAAEALFLQTDEPPPAVALFDPDFHEGVVGIVASRLKDKLHRPTFVFAASQAPGQSHILKGSGRSIAGFHLRDALDQVSKRQPGLLLRFGGHAMAAGCTLLAEHFARFERCFAEVAAELLEPASLQRRLETDGALAPEYRRIEIVDALQQEVWGQGFAAPTFSEEVEVLSQRLIGDKHLALKLRHAGEPVDAMWFGHTSSLPPRVRLAFRLEADEWRGVRKVRFLVEGAEI